MIDIRQLRHFIAVVDAQGFRAAAHRVHLSPSALTRSIQMIEAQYQVPLLDREKGGVRPTAHGEILARDARRIVTGFDEMEANLRQLSDLKTGRLRVGISPAICDLCRPSAVTDLVRRYPGTSIDLHCGKAEEQLELLDRDQLDILAAYDRPFVLHGGLTIQPLYLDRGAWYVRKGHPLLDRPTIGLEVLAEFPLVMQPLPGPFDEWFSDVCCEVKTRHGIDAGLTCALQSIDYELLVATLIDSDCIGLLPGRNARSGNRAHQLEVITLPHPPPPLTMALAWRADATPSPLMRTFVQAMKERIPES